MSNRYRSICFIALAAGSVAITDAAMRGAAAQSCSVMRKINIGVSVAPPNVVHTSPHVAKELGFFAKRCIEPNIIQFEGGASATASAAALQGATQVSQSRSSAVNVTPSRPSVTIGTNILSTW